MKRSSSLKRSGPMRKVGKVGRRRIKTSRLLTAEARANGHDFCELALILRELEIDGSPCFGEELENAHSVKCSERGSDPVLDRETARSCPHHHGITDSKTHAVQLRVIRTAIARREA